MLSYNADQSACPKLAGALYNHDEVMVLPTKHDEEAEKTHDHWMPWQCGLVVRSGDLLQRLE